MGFASPCQRKKWAGKELPGLAELCWRRRASTPNPTVPQGAMSRFSSPWASTGTGHLVPACAFNLKNPCWQVKPEGQQGSEGEEFGSLTLLKSMLLFCQTQTPVFLRSVEWGSLAASILPICCSVLPRKPSQVSLACSPNSPHFSHDFVDSSLCINAQSWEEKEYCSGSTRAG